MNNTDTCVIESFNATAPNVAICSVGELFGGVERHILTLADGLRERGVNPLILLFCEGELAAQLRQRGLQPFILPSSNRALLATLRLLAQILLQHQISVVHVHGYKATVYCALARRRHPFAVVKTVHGLPEPVSNNPLNMLRDRAYHALDCVATQACRATVCYVTQELQEQYRSSHQTLRAKVIPNGVTTSQEQVMARPVELETTWFNLVIVGRLDKVKGLHVAIGALASDYLGPDIHLHLIGSGPLAPELQAQAGQLGLSPRVHFLGFRRSALEYITFCDVLLMPSLHEGLPYTLLEAMAAGKPIIASCVGGLAEVLQHETTALLVPPGNPTDLGRAIAHLYAQPELRRRLGERAQVLARTHYSREAMTLRYLEVYRESLVVAGA